jgi:hypothetical protein
MMMDGSPPWPLQRDVDCGIAEFDGNPFIRRLPPPPSDRDLFSFLKSVPLCTDEERQLAPHLREQLAFVRVKQAFIPTGNQLRQASKIDQLIRSGYVARNPAEGLYQALMTELAEEDDEDILKRMDKRRVMKLGLAADSLVNLGPSGQGKTTLMRKALAAYPQVLRQTLPGIGTIAQIVWVRVEAASDGSTKQTILSLFAAIDELLNENYVDRFGGLTRERLLVKARQVCAKHAIGLIVVDEIQNLSKLQGGDSDLMKFLTSLVNVINVPILMIGTMKAVSMMQGSFRTARRGEGLGSTIYEPMRMSEEWSIFIRQLFALQWTRDLTEATPGIIETLWDESQGIIDIAVKLFVLSQMRAIRTGQRKGDDELITPALIRTVARESLKLVRPMIDALRRSDMKALARYDDLVDLEAHLAEQLAAEWNGAAAEAPDMNALVAVIGERLDASGGEMKNALLAAALLGNGVPEAGIVEIMKQVEAARSSSDPIRLAASVKSTTVGKPKARKRIPAPVNDPKDIRRAAGDDPLKELGDAGLLDDVA